MLLGRADARWSVPFRIRPHERSILNPELPARSGGRTGRRAIRTIIVGRVAHRRRHVNLIVGVEVRCPCDDQHGVQHRNHGVKISTRFVGGYHSHVILP